jgi:hypothetical protein
MATVYRIHPGIGIARMGDSEKSFFIGPEAPGVADFRPAPDGKYRDDTPAKGIRRQGARFRIYEYTFPDGGDPARPTKVREITDAEAEITWKVRLVNAKADSPGLNLPAPGRPTIKDADRAKVLRVDTGEQPLKGVTAAFRPLVGKFLATTAGATDVKLGDLLTDDAGRLIVLGGNGKSVAPFGDTVSGLHNS